MKVGELVIVDGMPSPILSPNSLEVNNAVNTMCDDVAMLQEDNKQLRRLLKRKEVQADQFITQLESKVAELRQEKDRLISSALARMESLKEVLASTKTNIEGALCNAGAGGGSLVKL